MKWLSRFLSKDKTSSHTQVVAESPHSMLSTWATLLASQGQFGPQYTRSEMAQSFIEFMASLQDLILTRARSESNEAEQRYITAQSTTLPHRVYGAKLYHDGVEWVCVWGGDDSQLVGRGTCPAHALMNFDLAWFGQPPKKEME